MDTDLDRNALLSDGLLTIREAAGWLRLSRSKVYELLDQGELTSVRIGRARRIPRNALIVLAERGFCGSTALDR